MPSLTKEENYALADQIKRAAYSLPATLLETIRSLRPTPINP